MSDFAELDELLKPATKRYKNLTLPVKKAKVRIESKTEFERSAWELSLRTKKGELNQDRIKEIRCRQIIAHVVDSSGKLLFNETHIQALKLWDVADTMFLSEEIGRHCGYGERDIEALAKNSEETSADSAP